MMDFNNPNDFWMHKYDPYKGMSDDENVKAGCMQVGAIIVGFILALVVCMLFGSCTTTKYIPVERQHTEHHWHTDSVHTTDSLIYETQTIVMELDSAEMAKYGIQLKQAERAWLIKTKELERQIQQLMQLSATRDTVRDSITVPYPVEVNVPAELTWWQQTRLHLANIVLYLLGIGAVLWLGKKHLGKLGG